MMNFFVNFLGYAINFFPFVYLCFLPFLNNLKCNKTQLLTITGIVCFVCNCVLTYLSLPGMGLKEYGEYFSVFMMILWMVSYFIVIKAAFTQKLFVLLVSLHFLVISEYLEVVLEGIFFPWADRQTFELHDLCLYLCIYAVMLPFVYKLMKNILDSINISNKRIWRLLWILPLGLTAFLVTFYELFMERIINGESFAFFFILNSVISPVTFYVTVAMLMNISRAVKLEHDISVMESQLEMQSKYYEQQTLHIQEIRKAKHDLRHYFALAEKYLKNNDKEGFAKYLKSHMESMPSDSFPVFCENYAVNVLCAHYANLCQENAIDWDFKVSVPNAGPISDIDLPVIFGNLLENAYEACMRMPPHSKKSIRLRAESVFNKMGIIIENSYNGICIIENEQYLSSKRNNRTGIGLNTIKTACKKYNGEFRIEKDNANFKVSLLLPISPKDCSQQNKPVTVST